MLAFVFGYWLTVGPLVSGGGIFRSAVRLALIADTIHTTAKTMPRGSMAIMRRCVRDVMSELSPCRRCLELLVLDCCRA